MSIPSLRRPFLFLLAALCVQAGASAQASKAVPSGQDKVRSEIAAMLNTFLAPENNGKAASHERFWADDLVYTGSSGVVRSKAEIMQSFATAPAQEAGKADEPASVFHAEDILVRPYGDTAALTFRLVNRAADGSTEYYRNSGTFLRRNGQWQAVTWQATKVAATAK
ncbi:nuclear transport factor 2 family protein [Rugamonas sp. CCM 8940]|uniref:nuclear transport factor 2 family protein n=1 Tax=Rugamonas sp. CCM 8940 TaxID=2765359 RepID=UPI0018F5AC14|nr:nuclear transport factor 2 family protein [Rugamonas sp. CCM 8940]MBJ7309825.1 nuclear transport factor 2 family protein [Rugamonas sp. CCM 8940]